MEYDGSGSQTMSGVDYYNLVVSGINGSKHLELGTSGDVTTNSNTLTIGASGSVSGAEKILMDLC